MPKTENVYVETADEIQLEQLPPTSGVIVGGR